jgi:ATP-dependent exoDNAse (exonuclease V) alpha subunit
LRINIDGTAGTGKSFLISAITKTLNTFAAERGLNSPIVRVAPTGIAAFNINESTLHETFSIPTKCFSRLTNAQELQLQRRLKDCKYIILDEKSMVGRRMLGYLDSRLRIAFPEKKDEILGGCSLLMFGDFGQLPPVGDTALFNLTHYDETTTKNIESNYGRLVYMNGINESITLNRVMRQQGENPSAVRFREVLSHVQWRGATEADCELLNTRCIEKLSPEEQLKFLTDGDTLYLCPRNAQVREINNSKMAASGNPVVKIPARHTGLGASKASSDEAEGLVSKLMLMEGAKVMLTRNIWTPQGLTNGSTGTIRTGPC